MGHGLDFRDSSGRDVRDTWVDQTEFLTYDPETEPQEYVVVSCGGGSWIQESKTGIVKTVTEYPFTYELYRSYNGDEANGFLKGYLAASTPDSSRMFFVGPARDWEDLIQGTEEHDNNR